MSSKKAEARERVKAMREEQARKDRARERMMRFGIAGAVLVGIGIIAIAVVSSGGDDDGGGEPPPVATGENDGIMVGDPDAPVTIQNWMDFLCPHCQEFETANGETIDQWVEAGEVNVVYNPVTYTGQTNSQRANNAFACAADEGKAGEFVKAAFASPQQWTDSLLKDLGEELDIGGNYEQCVDDGTYDSWSSTMTDSARDTGIQGTPTVFVNGEQVDDWSPQGLAAAVENAGGAGAEKPADDGQEEGAGNDAENTENGNGANEEEDPGAEDD